MSKGQTIADLAEALSRRAVVACRELIGEAWEGRGAIGVDIVPGEVYTAA